MSQDRYQNNNVTFGKKSVKKTVLLALGANLSSFFGPPDVTICLAMKKMAKAGLADISISRLFTTPAYPAGSGPDYVNAAVSCTSQLSPIEILAAMQEIETHFGRERGQRWGARSLDIDLLAVGADILPDEMTFRHWLEMPQPDQMKTVPADLILPHPRMHERGFVLAPLAEVAPNWRHPVLGKTVAEMQGDLPADALRAIKPIASPDCRAK